MTPSDLTHAIAVKRNELVRAIDAVKRLESELDVLRREEAVSQYRISQQQRREYASEVESLLKK